MGDIAPHLKEIGRAYDRAYDRAEKTEVFGAIATIALITLIVMPPCSCPFHRRPRRRPRG